MAKRGAKPTKSSECLDVGNPANLFCPFLGLLVLLDLLHGGFGLLHGCCGRRQDASPPAAATRGTCCRTALLGRHPLLGLLGLRAGGARCEAGTVRASAVARLASRVGWLVVCSCGRGRRVCRSPLPRGALGRCLPDARGVWPRGLLVDELVLQLGERIQFGSLSLALRSRRRGFRLGSLLDCGILADAFEELVELVVISVDLGALARHDRGSFRLESACFYCSEISTTTKTKINVSVIFVSAVCVQVSSSRCIRKGRHDVDSSMLAEVREGEVGRLTISARPDAC